VVQVATAEAAAVEAVAAGEAAVEAVAAVEAAMEAAAVEAATVDQPLEVKAALVDQPLEVEAAGTTHHPLEAALPAQQKEALVAQPGATLMAATNPTKRSIHQPLYQEAVETVTQVTNRRMKARPQDGLLQSLHSRQQQWLLRYSFNTTTPHSISPWIDSFD